MIELEAVFSDYAETKSQFVQVPSDNTTPALLAIRQTIPDAFNKFISAAGLDPLDFRVYGSVGQLNLNTAAVPWVAICKRTVTTSATDGYYIVALFAEDMSSVSMSLNQGYTAFKKRYQDIEVAYAKLEDCARAAITKVSLEIPPDFVAGPIDLQSTGRLALGYQAGSILAKTYQAGQTPHESVVQKDIEVLLKVYMDLADQYPKSLVDLDVVISADDLQETIESFASEYEKTEGEGNVKPSTVGPQPRPKKTESKAKPRYDRSLSIPGRALAMAKHTCALSTSDEPHHSFVSKKTKKSYVEAHHLVPFSNQEDFPHSLDVEENIVVLCPNCHRKLHHGTAAEKNGPLKQLLTERQTALGVRGISVSLDILKAMYDSLSADD